MTRVLFFLPNISGYIDRARLLMEVSRGLDHLYLMVGHNDAPLETEGYPRFTLLEVGFKRRARPLNLVRAAKVAGHLVEQDGIDVVNDTFQTLVLLLLLKKRPSPFKFVESIYIYNRWRMKYVMSHLSLGHLLLYNKSTLLNTFIEGLVCRFADYVVLQAPGLRQRLLEMTGIPHHRVRWLPNCVDTQFWTPPLERRRNRHYVRLLFVGGLDHSRGLFTMIKAMRLLKDRSFPCQLTLVGNWGTLRIYGRRGRFSRDEALRQIRAWGLEDRICILPRVDRETLRELYRSADLFIYQTINDGTPRVVLEALSCGLPVITSHHPGIDLIDPRGEFMTYAPFGDAQAVANAVEALASGGCSQERGHKGREAVVRWFDIKAVAPRFAAFYNAVSSEPSGPLKDPSEPRAPR